MKSYISEKAHINKGTLSETLRSLYSIVSLSLLTISSIPGGLHLSCISQAPGRLAERERAILFALHPPSSEQSFRAVHKAKGGVQGHRRRDIGGLAEPVKVAATRHPARHERPQAREVQ